MRMMRAPDSEPNSWSWNCNNQYKKTGSPDTASKPWVFARKNSAICRLLLGHVCTYEIKFCHDFQGSAQPSTVGPEKCISVPGYITEMPHNYIREPPAKHWFVFKFWRSHYHSNNMHHVSTAVNSLHISNRKQNKTKKTEHRTTCCAIVHGMRSP